MTAPAPSPSPVLLDWQAAAAAGPDVVGGKAWQLARLARYGLPVPDGLVLPALWQRRARDGDTAATLAALGTQLCAELDARGWLAQPLAVRSSALAEDGAAASFAGIYASQLNVRGGDAVCAAIAAVWASLDAPAAVAYRQRLGLAADAGMAVLIMPMLPAVAAGVAFSVDPRSGRHDRLLIAANWGLGLSVVNGSVEPDEYTFAQDMLDEQLTELSVQVGSKAETVHAAGHGVTRTAADPDQAGKRVLNETLASALAALVQDAARALDFARPFHDIEWAWDGARFWLLQARPVTAMPRHTYPALRTQSHWWSDGNARDVVPLPLSALEWSGVRAQVERVTTQYASRAGHALLPGVERTRLFAGRAYVNMALCQFEYWDAFGITPADFNRQLGGHQPEIRVERPGLARRLRWLLHWTRLLLILPRLRRRLPALAAAIAGKAAELRAQPLPGNAPATIALLREMRRFAFSQDDLCCLQTPGASSALVRELLARHLPDTADALAATLLAGGPPSITAQQGQDLAALAQLAAGEPAVVAWLRQGRHDDHPPCDAPGTAFRAAFADFLDRYGHRAVYESYLRSPRWQEAPGYLLDRIAALLDVDTSARRQAQAVRQEEAWAQVRAHLPLLRRLQLRLLLKLACEENHQRELARSSLIRLLAVGRHHYLQLAPRLQASGALNAREEIFELTPGEIEAALLGSCPAAGLQARIADRLAERARWAAVSLPPVIQDEERVPASSPAPAGTTTPALQGLAVAAGSASGPARVLRHPDDAARLMPGDILVCPSTDPAWTLLFLQADGLAMETGGYLSHGAIVARELGIPAVANVPDLLRQVQDGQPLQVDGNSGRIHT